MNKFVGVLCGLLLAQGASAACFDFVGAGPKQIGPVEMWGPASAVCVSKIKKIGGRIYWSIRFSDEKGDLAQISSQTELLGRCPGFCRSYTLTTGNSNGKNVNADNTQVQFQVETEEGKVTISHPSTGAQVYPVTKKQ